jgi:hypothetical protein
MTDTLERRAHWENVYTTKREDEVSWFQESPAPSLDLIRATGVGPDAAVIDIGGGASRLVDALLDEGFSAVTVLDLSERAGGLARALGTISGIAGEVGRRRRNHVVAGDSGLRSLARPGSVPLPDRGSGAGGLRRAAGESPLPQRSRDPSHLCPRWPRTLQWTPGDALQPGKPCQGAWPSLRACRVAAARPFHPLGLGTLLSVQRVPLRPRSTAPEVSAEPRTGCSREATMPPPVA